MAKLSRNQRITILISVAAIVVSVLALAMSAISIYYGYFRVSEKLNGIAESIRETDKNFTIYFALTNPGNQSILISRATLVTWFQGQKEGEDNVYWVIGYDGLTPPLPLTLKPGDIQNFSLETAYDSSRYLPKALALPFSNSSRVLTNAAIFMPELFYRDRQFTNAGCRPELQSFYVAMDVESVTPRGVITTSRLPITIGCAGKFGNSIKWSIFSNKSTDLLSETIYP